MTFSFKLNVYDGQFLCLLKSSMDVLCKYGLNDYLNEGLSQCLIDCLIWLLRNGLCIYFVFRNDRPYDCFEIILNQGREPRSVTYEWMPSWWFLKEVFLLFYNFYYFLINKSLIDNHHFDFYYLKIYLENRKYFHIKTQ